MNWHRFAAALLLLVIVGSLAVAATAITLGWMQAMERLQR